MVEIYYDVRRDKWVVTINNKPRYTFNTEIQAINQLVRKEFQCL